MRPRLYVGLRFAIYGDICGAVRAANGQQKDEKLGPASTFLAGATAGALSVVCPVLIKGAE